MYQVEGGQHIIMDQETCDDELIDTFLLFKVDFNLLAWYAEKRALKENIVLGTSHPWLTGARMGDALAWGILLTIHETAEAYTLVLYGLPAKQRWTVHREGDVYLIEDHDLTVVMRLRCAWVLDFDFNLVGWYHNALECHAEWQASSGDRTCEECCETCVKEYSQLTPQPRRPMGEVFGAAAGLYLDALQPFPGESMVYEGHRFEVTYHSEQISVVHDDVLGTSDCIATKRLRDQQFGLGNWYARQCARRANVNISVCDMEQYGQGMSVHDMVGANVCAELARGAPYMGDWLHWRSSLISPRFEVVHNHLEKIELRDKRRGMTVDLPWKLLKDLSFDVQAWYEMEMRRRGNGDNVVGPDDWPSDDKDDGDAGDTDRGPPLGGPGGDPGPSGAGPSEGFRELQLSGVQIPHGSLAALQRNAAIPKDFTRTVPKPVVVVVHLNGHPARALLDSGSLGDFVSTALVDQLKLAKVALTKPLSLQLAVQGSRSKVNWGVKAAFQYQNIKEERYFDVANLSNYDLILGTPWWFQHRLTVGLNPARVVVGSNEPVPIVGDDVSKISSRAMEMLEGNLEKGRAELLEYAQDLCKELGETDLPPFRAINHEIPLIDEDKIYPWRPSRCPEVYRAQWAEKKDIYLKSGRWKISSARNTVPMMFIAKPGRKIGNVPELRTVVDLRARNANTLKMSSPLPDIDGVLRRVASARYRSLLDLKNAYEQIRIIPEHVERSAVTTPDGNMVSLVVQIGDCNAPATYQALMNHLFSSYIGRFLDVYLDDIIIYSDTFRDHMGHVRLVIDILQREKLYLSVKKLFFFQTELKLLGRIVGDQGI